MVTYLKFARTNRSTSCILIKGWRDVRTCFFPLIYETKGKHLWYTLLLFFSLYFIERMGCFTLIPYAVVMSSTLYIVFYCSFLLCMPLRVSSLKTASLHLMVWQRFVCLCCLMTSYHQRIDLKKFLEINVYDSVITNISDAI